MKKCHLTAPDLLTVNLAKGPATGPTHLKVLNHHNALCCILKSGCICKPPLLLVHLDAPVPRLYAEHIKRFHGKRPALL